MTEDKLQCYVKSVKTDALYIAHSLKPVIIWGVGGVLLVVVGGLALVGVSVIMDSLITTISPYFQWVNEWLFTQHNGFIACMIGLDALFLILVGQTQVNPKSSEGGKDVTGQVGLTLFALTALFALNGIIITTAPPEKITGWSYMYVETGINAALIVLAILLVRAYVKCEVVEKVVNDEQV